MVQIIQFPTDEKISEDIFVPEKKLGLLIVGKNYETGYVGVPDYPRWNPFVSGNLNMYDWEMLMTGTIDFGKRCPLNRIDDIVYAENGRIRKYSPEQVVRRSLSGELEWCESGKSRTGRYEEVAKIWPGTTENLPEYEAAISRFSSLSTPDTLTSIIIFSHGLEGCFQMGDNDVSYRKFLDDLDSISGKKTVFLYACHSGSFLDQLRIHPSRRDYAAITSCDSASLSTNWNDIALDETLYAHFAKGRSFSDLELGTMDSTGEGRSPKVLRYFNTRLVE